MVMISLDKFFLVYRPMIARSIKMRTRIGVCAGCALCALVWSTLPLLGWSHYSLDVARTSCALEWMEQSASVISFNTTIFVFVFLVPISLIVVFNAKLVIFLDTFYHKKIAIVSKPKPKNRSSASSSSSKTSHPHEQQSMAEHALIVQNTKLVILNIVYICKFYYLLYSHHLAIVMN